MTERAEIGTQFILLRGLARESRHWGKFPAELQGAFGGKSRVDCIDLPGTGRFSEMKSPLFISEITDFAREKYLEIRSRQRESGAEPARTTYLLAVSLGGMIAADWVTRWPDDFSGMILINTSFRGFSPIFKRLRPQSLLHLAHIVRAPSARDRELEILRMICNRHELRAVTAEEWAKIHDSRPISFENFARQLFAAACFHAPPERPAIPTLVLVSEKDRMVDNSCGKEIAKTWDLDLKIHPTAGHDLTLEDAPWVCERVQAWVSTLP